MNPTQPVTAPAWARFDDLRAGTGLRFGAPHRTIAAHRPAEVAPALAELDRATRAGAWAYGYVGYESAPGLDEHLVTREPRADGPPLLWFGLCDQPVDVAVVEPAPGRDDPERQWHPTWTPAWTTDGYHDAVHRVRGQIAAGETYQCNLTVRLRARTGGDPERLYADLALGQRGAYSAYLDLGRFVVASASPELFFEWRGDRLVTRPMKGTAVRGRDVDEDRRNGDALRASAKERAENIMIVDLMRNDLARIARTGGVTVTSLCALERYETVLQLTSEVAARVRPDVGLVDVFRALFPCGSVTGAPKARTMELIRELEDSPRGVYCGAIGYLGPPGAAVRARFSVAIRTVVLDRDTGAAEYGTGGGITWGSGPAAEHAELLAKAALLHHRPREFQLRETLGYRAGAGLRNLDRHLARLARSAAYFGFPLDAERATAALAEAVRDRDTALVRLSLDRSGAITVQTRPLPVPLERPVRLAVDAEPIDSSQPWPYHKTSRREPYESRLHRHPDADDVILVNERGELTETTIANLAVHLDGRWWTPPVRSGCLPGVERERLVGQGVLGERVVRPEDLPRADGLALVSSVRGWRAARLVGSAEHHTVSGVTG